MLNVDGESLENVVQSQQFKKKKQWEKTLLFSIPGGFKRGSVTSMGSTEVLQGGHEIFG